MITIDYQSKLPLYEQIAKRFQTHLKRRASTRFADAFRSFPRNGSSINPNTIQKAYSLLEQER